MIRSNSETRSRSLWMLVSIPLLLFVFMLAFPMNARAAAYKVIPTNGPVKAGKYYIKTMETTVLYSKKKNSGYVEAGSFSGPIYSDGTYIVTVQRTDATAQRLVRITLKSGKTKVLKKLPIGKYQYEPPYWSVSGIYDDNIFLTRNSFEDWRYTTYAYDLGTKKFKKVKDNCSISAMKGKYAVAAVEYQTDVSAHPHIILKASSGGKLKQVKKLGNYILNTAVIGKKIYYSKYTDKDMKKATLCRCSMNGKNVEKLGTFKTTAEYSQVYIYEITSKDCLVNKDGIQYKYTYKNKKLSKTN